jgi:ferrous iron transport protein B
VYFYIIGKFFPACQNFVSILLYLPGILLGTLVAVIGGRMRFSSLERAENDTGDNFLLELPPYRVPLPSSVFSKTLANLWQFIKKASTIMLVLSLGVWLADRTGLMYQIGKVISPVFRPVGFGVPEAVVAVLTGFGAKEAIVSSLSVFEAEGFVISEHITKAGAAAMLCFISAYTPCVAAITALNKELGSKKITAALLVSQLVISYAAAGVVYFVFSFIF